jgi:F-type H+-transporting ATPase subunit delta
MRIKPKQYAISLYEAVRDVPSSEVKVVIENFVKLLVKNNAFKMAPQILSYLKSHVNKMEGIADLKVKTAEPLGEENLSRLKKIIPTLLKREIKTINVQQEINPNLIGGFILECDDLVFDASIKNKFNVLKNNLSI